MRAAAARSRVRARRGTSAHALGSAPQASFDKWYDKTASMIAVPADGGALDAVSARRGADLLNEALIEGCSMPSSRTRPHSRMRSPRMAPS